MKAKARLGELVGIQIQVKAERDHEESSLSCSAMTGRARRQSKPGQDRQSSLAFNARTTLVELFDNQSQDKAGRAHSQSKPRHNSESS